MVVDRVRLAARLMAAGQRWEARAEARAKTSESLVRGGPAAADSAERVAASEEWRSIRRGRSTLTVIERVIGTRDFHDLPPTPGAGLAAAPVARIVEVLEPGFEPRGFGSGFMVARGILMTNNHVLPAFDDVQFAAANFGHARVEGRVASGTIHPFSADPDEFVTVEDLDFTLIGLAQDPGLGHHPLIGSIGKILVGQPVSIIQHPSGGPRRYAVDDNLLVDVLPDFLHYTTDTEPGSSGSPTFNHQWEVVALHHSGVPRVREGAILTRSGAPWNPNTMSDDDIDWVANEGVRVSRIVARLQELRQREPRLARFIDRVLAAGRAELDEATLKDGAPSASSTANATQGDGMSSTTIHIHAPTVIYTGSNTLPEGMRGAQTPYAGPVSPLNSLDSKEGISVDPNYASREGYAAGFLGKGIDIPLPTIPEALRVDVAPLLDGDPSGLLKYHHFSIVMNGRRKLPFFTAVNIDGKKGKRPARVSDRWFFDPRMSREHQIGEELYRANPLDRGHLVRRLDPAWGPLKVAKVANDDTFHFTNCSPQHSNLNQKIWVDLEDYLLDHAQEDDVKLIVFTGPVFDGGDPTYRGVQLPRRFWKVAVMRDAQGLLLTSGFVQSQRNMIANLREADFLRQDLRTDQIKVAQVEALTGLNFGLPREADAMTDEPDVALPEAGGIPGRRLAELEDIRLR